MTVESGVSCALLRQKTLFGERKGLTPCTSVWVINGRVDVAEVYFAHEAINLLTKLENTSFGWKDGSTYI